MILEESILTQIIQERPLKSHKGDYGHLLLIGGFYPYAGAIIMAAQAAVASGAGLVTVASEKETISPLHARLPEAMALDVADQSLFLQTLHAADSVLLGPGLSENSKAESLFDLVIEHVSEEQVLILDGSAINLMAKRKPKLKAGQNLILTPHEKEWERLSGLTINEQTEAASQKALKQFPEGTILVAKSHQTKLIQGDSIYQLSVGGPYQATGGMGDTLAGMIAGFSGQFPQASLLEKVQAATYLHAYIADQEAKVAYVVLPSRISQVIPKWMQTFAKKS